MYAVRRNVDAQQSLWVCVRTRGCVRMSVFVRACVGRYDSTTCRAYESFECILDNLMASMARSALARKSWIPVKCARYLNSNLVLGSGSGSGLGLGLGFGLVYESWVGVRLVHAKLSEGLWYCCHEHC